MVQIEKNAIIFEIDDILADTNNRYERHVNNCSCILNIHESCHLPLLLLKYYEYYKFFKNRGYPIYIFTSRNERYRKRTNKWLHLNNIQYEQLVMRGERDYRPGYALKEENLNKMFSNTPKTTVKAVFESEISCITMYREYGLKVYDCREKEKEIYQNIKGIKQIFFRYAIVW